MEDHRIGIMAAMPEELDSVLALLTDRRPEVRHGSRTFHAGRIGSRSVVAAFSRWGKVAAAATATELVARFEVKSILLTGLAGGVGDGVRIGDLVVPDALIQHDLDARPLFPRFEVPLTGASTFKTDPVLRDRLLGAARAFARTTGVRVHTGLLASGDQFVATDSQRRRVLSALPNAIAVDMEAAAVAQVAADYGVPFAVVRLISDAADADAAAAFTTSLAQHAGACAGDIFSHLFA